MRTALVFAVMYIASCATSIPTPTLYESWGQQLASLSEANGKRLERIEDVSLLLGTPPSRCDPVSDSSLRIGVLIDLKSRTIRSVSPGGPAADAGLQRGDTIEAVAGIATATGAGVIEQIKSESQEGRSLEIRTIQGTYQVIPRRFTVEQCYWEIHAGGVSRAGGSAYVNPYWGSADASSAAYQRFFRASCRIDDGYLTGCQSNWQQ